MRLMSQRFLNGIKCCTICGSKFLMQGYDSQQRIGHLMQTRQICHTCAYWQDLIIRRPEHTEVMGRRCYKVYPLADRSDKTVILGGRGKKRYFIRPDHTVLMSNDIWMIGMVPDRFAEHFPETIKEITRKAYVKLNNNPRVCKARGCFDRYNCLRYNLSIEADEIGAYNTPPSNWKPGDEHCMYFINSDNIKNDSNSL